MPLRPGENVAAPQRQAPGGLGAALALVIPGAFCVVLQGAPFTQRQEVGSLVVQHGGPRQGAQAGPRRTHPREGLLLMCPKGPALEGLFAAQGWAMRHSPCMIYGSAPTGKDRVAAPGFSVQEWLRGYCVIPVAAGTSHHKFRRFKQHTFIVSQSWRSEVTISPTGWGQGAAGLRSSWQPQGRVVP